MQLLHRFRQDISGIELPVRFNNPFYYSPHRLCMIAADEVRANMLGSEVVAAVFWVRLERLVSVKLSVIHIIVQVIMLGLMV